MKEIGYMEIINEIINTGSFPAKVFLISGISILFIVFLALMLKSLGYRKESDKWVDF